MDVLLLNATDTGGAATATRRIHGGLRESGINSRLLVQDKRSKEPSIIGPETKFRRGLSKIRPTIDQLPLKIYGGVDEPFSIGWVPERIDRHISEMDPDIIHLNWVGGGFLDVKTLEKIEQPIVWRLPDMWAFTGGCHYSGTCNRYTKSCGSCPKLGSTKNTDVTRWTWRRKFKAWSDIGLTVVATTPWLASRVKESSLLGDKRIETIPNGLDTTKFKPYPKELGRDVFQLPKDKKLILFGAINATSDRRKGYDLLIEALSDCIFQRTLDDVELVVFGSPEPEDPLGLGIKTHYTGYLDDDESLSLLYAASDVMVVPSRYESFGQTITESLACGTPVVAFNASGPSDLITHKETGYLAQAYDTEELAEGIRWILEDPERLTRLGNTARKEAVEHFEIGHVTDSYVELYEDLL